jgi:hypothetical protein
VTGGAAEAGVRDGRPTAAPPARWRRGGRPPCAQRGLVRAVETDEQSWSASATRHLEAPTPSADGKYAHEEIAGRSGKILVPAFGRIEKEMAQADRRAETAVVEVLEVNKYIARPLEMEDPKVVDRQTALIDIYHKIRPATRPRPSRRARCCSRCSSTRAATTWRRSAATS